ncbi:MAG: hypothetical protein BGO98_19115 [Myxococcales bacterium 68-20]|nr:DUF4142 domain-containing protein [Myxococcales bacterium]OJY24740.1 MAG: hypothetical protein BGO98_19115 [Myxococcales bacterium 68-20]
MKRFRIFLFSCLVALAMIAIAASCSDEDGAAPRKSSTGRYYRPKDAGKPAGDVDVPPFDAGEFDVFAPDMQIPKEISTVGQAVQALITAYDLEVKEAEYGQANAQTPPIKAYAGDLIRDVKTSRARLKGLIASKEIAPRRTNLTDRLKFESQAALSQLTGIFRNMWLNLWVNRRIDSANNTRRMLNDQLEPILAEDEDFAQELETIRAELDARVDRAERVRDGLAGGLDNGMFEEMDDIPPPQKPQQQPQKPLQQPQLPQQQPQQPAEDAGAAP